jgi:hypothetical protein
MVEEFRVTTLYATSWRAKHSGADSASLTDHLTFDQLEPFYRTAADQFPDVVTVRDLAAETANFHRWRGNLTSGRLWLFVLPSEQVVAGLTVTAEGDLLNLVELLEDCHERQLRFAGSDVEALALAEARAHDVRVDRAEFSPERHQLVAAAALPGDDPEDVVQRLVHRSDLDYRPEFSNVSYPTGLNRHPPAVAAVGPFVSILAGQQEHVEHAAIVSAVQATASAARLREIRHALYHQLREFRTVEHSPEDTRSRRLALEGITDNLTRLELDLSVAVETPIDLGMLVPSSQIVEYHVQLYTSMGIGKLAENVSRMLRRLEATGRAELTSVESIERRADEDRHLRWAVAVGFISVVAIPPSLVLAFFGGSAAEIDETRSMFHPSYWWLYILVGLIVLIAVALGVTLYLIQRRRGTPS